MADQQPPHSRIPAVAFFEQYSSEHRDTLAGKKVYDLSAGSGYIANLFAACGADMHLYDLFPDQNIFCKEPCQFINLQQPLPIDDNMADVVISSETIEHLPNQLHFFSEVARILKPGGTFILTTPNASSLRSRFSQFIGESEHYNSPLPDEHNVFTKWPGKETGYYSKLFISGVLRLRTLAAVNRLRIAKLHPTAYSSTSRLLMIFYPFIWHFSRKNLKRSLTGDALQDATAKEIFRINTSPKTLLSKHLIIEFEKRVDEQGI